MKRLFIGLAVAGFALAAISTTAMASTAKTAKKHHHMVAAKTMKCPYCGMIMTTTKSAAAPVPVKINGVTYYCCKACHMGSTAGKKKPA